MRENILDKIEHVLSEIKARAMREKIFSEIEEIYTDNNRGEFLLLLSYPIVELSTKYEYIAQ